VTIILVTQLSNQQRKIFNGRLVALDPKRKSWYTMVLTLLRNTLVFFSINDD
jgi:hypothetical protein